MKNIHYKRLICMLLVWMMSCGWSVGSVCAATIAENPVVAGKTIQTTTQKTKKSKKTTLKIIIPKKKNDKEVEKVKKAIDRYNQESYSQKIEMVVVEKATIDVSNYDGMIIPGGCHVNAKCYGQERTVDCKKLTGSDHKYNDALDALELKLIKKCVALKKPILGICRGSQILNVYFGGTLNQNIGLSHYGVWKKVQTLKNSSMYKLLGSEVEARHYHHQAVQRLAKNLVVTMKTGSCIEGFEHKTLPIIGVQWHPELMYSYKNVTDSRRSTGEKVLKYFFEMCVKYKKSK